MMLKLLSIGLLSLSCAHVPRTTPGQGIEGTVFPSGGNLMPAPNRKATPPKEGVPATVCVFELTNISQAEQVGDRPYFKIIHTRLVKQVATDEKGHFRIELPVGQYSIFTKKDDLFYASRRDEHNNLAPVEVLSGKMTRIDCKVETAHPPVY